MLLSGMEAIPGLRLIMCDAHERRTDDVHALTPVRKLQRAMYRSISFRIWNVKRWKTLLYHLLSPECNSLLKTF